MVILELFEMINRTEHFGDLGMQKYTVSRLVSLERNSWIKLLSRKRLSHIDQPIVHQRRMIIGPGLGETSLHLCMLSKVKCLIKGVNAYRSDEIIKNITIPLINGLNQTVPTWNPRNYIANLFTFILQDTGPAHQSPGLSSTNIMALLTFLLLLRCSLAAESN
jgi:hypothetical protein